MGNTAERLKGAAQEIGGRVKEGVGAALDKEQLEREGRAEQAQGQARQDVAKTSEKVKGFGEEAKGRVQSTAGAISGDEKQEAKGKAEELKGQARQKLNE